jgi:hypothetical protein
VIFVTTAKVAGGNSPIRKFSNNRRVKLSMAFRTRFENARNVEVPAAASDNE